jgi:chaperonin cofactor prefoldin
MTENIIPTNPEFVRRQSQSTKQDLPKYVQAMNAVDVAQAKVGNKRASQTAPEYFKELNAKREDIEYHIGNLEASRNALNEQIDDARKVLNMIRAGIDAEGKEHDRPFPSLRGSSVLGAFRDETPQNQGDPNQHYVD